MSDLQELGNQLRVDPPVPPSPVPQLRTRIVRRRRRRRGVAALLSVAVVGTGAVLATRHSDGERVQLQTAERPSTAQTLTGPSFDGLPRAAKPTGPVQVLTHGTVGTTRWWLITFPGRPIRIPSASGKPRIPDADSWCTFLVNDDGHPFTGGSSCSTVKVDRGGSSFGFAHIGDHAFITGTSARNVDGIELRLNSGRVLHPRLHPVRGLTSRIWVIDYPVTGHGMSYLPRAQAAIAKLSYITGGRRFALFPSELSPNPPVVPPTVGDPVPPPTVGTPKLLTFSNGISLRVENSTPTSDGTPRRCVTTSVGKETGVRTCIPITHSSSNHRLIWSYFDGLTDRWIFTGAIDHSPVDLHLGTGEAAKRLALQVERDRTKVTLDIGDGVARPLVLRFDGDQAFFAISLPLNRASRLILTTGDSVEHIDHDSGFIVDGVRVDDQMPAGAYPPSAP